jgi:molybdopterin-binding protein
MLTKVVLDVDRQTITSTITRDACRDSGLRVGERAAALDKATEVMIIRPFPKRS